MSSSIILADHAVMKKSPAEILRECNNAIYANNREMMFVTAWIGILEISSGILKCASAGHSHPIIKNGNGCYEQLRGEHDLCLGIIENTDYNDYDLIGEIIE